MLGQRETDHRPADAPPCGRSCRDAADRGGSARQRCAPGARRSPAIGVSRITLACGILLGLEAGFAPARPFPATPQGSPPATNHETDPSRPSQSSPEGAPLTLRNALERAFAQSPALLVSRLEKEAREAAALQAGLLPNPRLEFQAEDLVGSGDFNVASQPQTTIWLSQLFELGGKRAARLRTAALGSEIASLEYAATRLVLAAEVRQAFVAALGAQQMLALSDETLRVAERTVAIATERVRAGDAAAVEATRARAAIATTRLAHARRTRDLETARLRLARTWGESTARFGELLGSLEETPPIPSLEVLLTRLADTPEQQRWSKLAAEGRARVELESAHAVPDVLLSAGYRRFYDTDNNALVAGAAIPLPVFDRNQGGIAAAKAHLEQAEENARSARTLAESALLDAHRELVAAEREVVSFDTEIRPGAERSYAMVADGYRLGRFELSELLDAQRTLFTAREDQLRARIRLHEAATAVERLTGVSLAEPGEAAGTASNTPGQETEP